MEATPIVVTQPPWDHTVHLWATKWSTRYHVSDSIADIILRAADRYDVDRDLAFALVYVESGFDPSVMSVAYARGLTQVMLATARYMDPSITTQELYDPRINADLGFQHLAFLLQHYEDTHRALVAYNAGLRVASRHRTPADHPYTQLVSAALIDTAATQTPARAEMDR